MKYLPSRGRPNFRIVRKFYLTPGLTHSEREQLPKDFYDKPHGFWIRLSYREKHGDVSRG
jgi:hypothetical protein